MKILVFEYISGGGLAGETIPDSLAREGRMMLQALLHDLKGLPGIQVLLPLDARCTELEVPAETEILRIGDREALGQWIPPLINRVDAVWPIAPETGGALAELVERVEAQGKILLTADVRSVRLFADKYATFRALTQLGLPCVPSFRMTERECGLSFPAVLKPIDGAGCGGIRIVKDKQGLSHDFESRDVCDAYILQPLLDGQSMSLSCLFARGKGWLLCCNRQQVTVSEKGFVLRGCTVNVPSRFRANYIEWVDRIAAAMPGLIGYVGIDLLENPYAGPMILEVNPRLTTSYSGIRNAIGVNVAEQVLKLLKGEPDPQNRYNVPVEVSI